LVCDTRCDAAVRRQAVDAAVIVGGEKNLVFERQQIVDVLLFGTPQRLDGVIRVDAIDGGFVDAAHVHHGRELSAHLRSGNRERLIAAAAWRARAA
jgi:hypothetical protein